LLKINLRACMDELAGGNESLFLQATGLGQNTLRRWLSGQLLPRLDSLLTVCVRLSIPLFRFITKPMSFAAGDWEHARDVVARHQAFRSHQAPVVRAALTEALQSAEPKSLSDIAWQVGFKHEKSLRKYGPEAFRALLEREQALQAVKGPSDATDSIPSKRIEQALEIALRQDPAPSARDVSLSLGLPSASWLAERFPGPCRALVQQSKEYRRKRRLEAEKVLKAALIEEPLPTVNEVAARVGHRNGQMLQYWLADLYAALAARSSRRRDWRLAKLQSILETAVTQEPPPSGEAVATGAGITPGHLRTLFPNLWLQVVARHATYRKQQNERNRHGFQETVRRIAQELLEAGKYPSRRRVQALLTESKLRGGHLIVREVKKVVAEFSGQPATVASGQ
jgi:hypothetical protein